MHTPAVATTIPPGQRIQSNAKEAAHPDRAGAVLRSSELLKGQRTIAITHNGATYQLQATRQGKLILTK